MSVGDSLRELTLLRKSLQTVQAYLSEYHNLHNLNLNHNILAAYYPRELQKLRVEEFQPDTTWSLSKLENTELYEIENSKDMTLAKSGFFNRKKFLREQEPNLAPQRLANVLHSGRFGYYHRDVFPLATVRKIIKADENMCRLCERPQEYFPYRLHLHHILPGYGEHFENGITLCKNCHISLHARGLRIFNPLLRDYDRDNWNKFCDRFKIKKSITPTKRTYEEPRDDTQKPF